MWLGVDFGEARIGLALYDPAVPQAAPRPHSTVAARDRKKAVAAVLEAARLYGVARIVVGVPLAPDGGVGMRAAQARNFARALSAGTEIPMVLQDERDSSREALDRLIAAGVPMKRRAERIDAMAAAVILERYVREAPAPPAHSDSFSEDTHVDGH